MAHSPFCPHFETPDMLFGHTRNRKSFMCRSFWMKPRFFACFLWLDPFCVAAENAVWPRCQVYQWVDSPSYGRPPAPAAPAAQPYVQVPTGLQAEPWTKRAIQIMGNGNRCLTKPDTVPMRMIVYAHVALWSGQKTTGNLGRMMAKPHSFPFFNLAQADPLCKAPSSSKMINQVLYKVLNRSRPPILRFPNEIKGSLCLSFELSFRKAHWYCEKCLIWICSNFPPSVNFT